MTPLSEKTLWRPTLATVFSPSPAHLPERKSFLQSSEIRSKCNFQEISLLKSQQANLLCISGRVVPCLPAFQLAKMYLVSIPEVMCETFVKVKFVVFAHLGELPGEKGLFPFDFIFILSSEICFWLGRKSEIFYTQSTTSWVSLIHFI